MSENNTKQELWDGIEVFAIIDPNKKQTLRNFILQLGETVLSEIADTAAESKDHSAIHSCIAAIHMPEDIDNPEKIKKIYKRNLKQGYKALVVCADGGTISYPSDWSEEKVRESFKEENKEGEFFFELSDFEK